MADISQSQPVSDVKSISTGAPRGSTADIATREERKEIANEAALPQTQTQTQSDVTVESPQSKLSRLLERFVKIEKLIDSHFKVRAVCIKCGWQTMQISEDAALQLLRVHVQSHWRDVSHEF